MLRRFSTVALVFFCALSFGFSAASYADLDRQAQTLYSKLGLNGKLGYDILKQALVEFHGVEGKQKPYLTIIDYTRPSSEKRFFVIDVDSQTLLFNTVVAHGKNTGVKYAKNFSNTVNSKKTSLGVFLTAETYWGGNGYSLRLDGLSPGLNDNARRRYIVVHGADYAENTFLAKHGRLGRSWGCPALPNSLAPEVIDTIKDGSVIFAHG